MRNLYLFVFIMMLQLSVYAEKRIYFFYGWERETALPSFGGEAVDYRPGGGNYYENWGRNTLAKSVDTPYRLGMAYTKITVLPPASIGQGAPYPTYAGVFVNGRQTIIFDGVRKDWYLHFAIRTDHKGSFNLLFYENWKYGAQKKFNINKYIAKTDNTWAEVNIPVSDMIDAGLDILTWDMRYDSAHDPYLYYLGFEGIFDNGLATTNTSLDDMYFTNTTPTAIHSIQEESAVKWIQTDHSLENNLTGSGIILVDLMGRIVRKTSSSKIDLMGLPQGCYIAKSGSSVYRFQY